MWKPILFCNKWLRKNMVSCALRLAQVWLKRWQASGEENHYVIRDQYLDPGLPHGYDPRSFRKHRAAFGYVCGRD